MKKLFLLVLVFVMLLGSTAQADPEYIGAWTAVLETGEIVFFRLLQDHSVYYLAQAFPAGAPVSGILPGKKSTIKRSELSTARAIRSVSIRCLIRIAYSTEMILFTPAH